MVGEGGDMVGVGGGVCTCAPRMHLVLKMLLLLLQLDNAVCLIVFRSRIMHCIPPSTPPGSPRSLRGGTVVADTVDGVC